LSKIVPGVATDELLYLLVFDSKVSPGANKSFILIVEDFMLAPIR